MCRVRDITPQENKIRDYTNQRKNVYGENDKSSRKALRKRKRWVNRAFRRTLNNIEQNSNLEWDEIDVELNNCKRHVWKKYPDALIVEVMDNKWSDSSRTKFKPVCSALKSEAIRRIYQSNKRIGV